MSFHLRMKHTNKKKSKNMKDRKQMSDDGKI